MTKFLAYILPCLFALVKMSESSLNERPVIGVLAQETYHGVESTKRLGDSYIRSAYVKYMQQAGALVVPIEINKPREYYTTLFSHINGIIIPGGKVNITHSGYASAGKLLYDMAIKANENGDHFPILGICLGFELLTALVAGRNVLTSCDAEDLPLKLNFSKDASESRLFRDLSADMVRDVTSDTVAYNAHHFCLDMNAFHSKENKLEEFFRLISTNYDRKNLEFVATVEAFDYPFYGLQWHPEKNMYFWDTTASIQHSGLGVVLSQFISDFFVNEARRSQHQFPSLQYLSQSVIDNFNSVFMGFPSFVNTYYFNTTK